MLSLILAATIGQQIAREDYALMRATEFWVIDQLPDRPKRYGKYIPKRITEQTILWSDPCHRCRKRASETLVGMGPEIVRWLFWVERSTDEWTRLYVNSVLRALVQCKKCGGTGFCRGFQPREGLTTVCANCWYGEDDHGTEMNLCRHCCGEGVFEKRLFVYWWDR
jgi:hypothetical protein